MTSIQVLVEHFDVALSLYVGGCSSHKTTHLLANWCCASPFSIHSLRTLNWTIHRTQVHSSGLQKLLISLLVIFCNVPKRSLLFVCRMLFFVLMELLGTAAAEGGGEWRLGRWLSHIVSILAVATVGFFPSWTLSTVATSQCKWHKKATPRAAPGKGPYTINGNIKLDWRKYISSWEYMIENKYKETII